MSKFDSEGQVIRADFGDFTLYLCVRAIWHNGGNLRQDFKMEFLAEFNAFISNLKKERPPIYLFAATTILLTNPLILITPKEDK